MSNGLVQILLIMNIAPGLVPGCVADGNTYVQ